MNHQLKKGMFIFLACGMAASFLAGCSGMSRSDAEDYVQSALDAGYKGEFGKYAKITDSTQEEAKALYNGNMEAFLASVGLDAQTSPHELKEQYEELFQQIFALEKYTVGEAKETDNGYEVPVEIEKLLIFSDVDAELEAKLVGQVKELGTDASEEDVNRLALETMYGMLQERVANPVYGEKETLDVHVAQNDAGTWNISQKDLEALDEEMME